MLKLKIYNFFSVVLSLLLISTIHTTYAGEADQALNDIKNQAVQKAYSYGDSAIESWARDNLSSLRLIEIETRSRADSKPTFRAITLFELSGSQFKKLLSQISYSTYNNRETLNTGLILRSMDSSMTHIYGFNIFYDHEFNTGHARTSLGFEMKSSVYDLNINLYEATSELNHVDGAPEVAARGYDAEVGALLPYLPWAKLYYKRYQWNSVTKNIRHGETVSLYMEPTSRLSIETGMQDDSTTNSHNAFIKLNYILCCNERKVGPSIFTVSSNAYTFGKVNEERMYEKVRRENNIVSVRGGGGLTITASGF